MWYRLQCYQLLANTVPSDGVWLSLNGTAIANDSYVDIGCNDEGALLCHTDRMDCCPGSNAAGNWFFPNGTRVEDLGYNYERTSTSFFSRGKGPSVIRLRRRGTPTKRQRFYYEVPDANDVMQIIYVNIGE